ncbi:MAG: OmpP1/FadL family transporter [Ignavibacteria bacterium]
MKKVLLFMALVVFISTAGAQNGTRLIGFDARSMGRGGTSVGYFDGPELMMTNPGGISFLSNSVVNADFSLMIPSLKFQNTLNTADGDKNYFPLPSAGYINKYKKNSKWTWGIGIFTNGGMGADFNLRNSLYRTQTFSYNPNDSTYYPVKGDYSLEKYHSKFAVMQGGLSIAYKLSESFSAGISGHLVYSQMEFQMPYSLSPSIMKGTPNNNPSVTFGQMFSALPPNGFGYNEVTASANMTDLNVFTFGGKIGLAYKVNEKLTFGLTYSSPVTLKYKNGKATMDMSKQFEDAFGKAIVGFYSQPGTHGAPLDTAMKYVGINFYQMGIDMSKGVQASYDLEVGLKLPQSVSFGVSFQPIDNFKFGLDVEWLNWANAFDKMTLTMTNGSSDNVNKMMGGNSINIDFPLNWKNSVIVKVGTEFFTGKEFTMRLGYAYGSNPVPENTIFPVFPAIVEHHLTIGAGYKFNNNTELNFAYETGLNKSLTGSNPHTVASEFANSTSELQTSIFHLSFNYYFK